MSYDHQLTDDEKRELCRIARATLREYTRTERIPPGKPHRESLVRNAGVFVSLHRGEELRGCIGTQEESTPLYKTIQNMAVAAASRDPRFPPVSGDELDDLTIEISVLGDRRQVHGPDDIEIGRDGLFIRAAGRQGLLLPQVATDAGWDAATFFEHVCKKAGLPGDAWQDSGAFIEAFSAQVFSEATHPMPK
jgi:AmmeMemoRadiSam system protein A